MREEFTFCRLCGAGCGMKITVADDDRIVSLQADREHGLSRGYACFKGLHFGEAHHAPGRILHPLKRQADGSFKQIDSETALSEIAERLKPLLGEHGPEAVGMFCGNGTISTYLAYPMQRAFMAAIGSTQRYSTITMDQSAKFVSFERMGGWAGGAIQLETSDVALLFGTNPLVSHGAVGVLSADPVKRLKEARARGTKFIVVDPRLSETARHADVHLQPLPGHDFAIAAAMIRMILDEGWHDADFCTRFVKEDGLARLREVVDPFAAAMVERDASLQPGDIRRATALFAQESRRGVAVTATGPCFGPHSNLAQHLVDCLNVICGRFPRVGEKIEAIDVLGPLPDYREEVIPPPRSWQGIPPSRIRGVGMLIGERLTGTLADEILTPGAGQLRALIVNGGNPVNSVPDQSKITRALDSLDLLVVVDPFMSDTARRADYILPPKLMYERPELPISFEGFPLLPFAWSQYTPAIVAPPPGSDVVDDWYPLWRIAALLGRQIRFEGVDLDMGEPPTSDDLIAIRARHAVVPLDEIKRHRRGARFDLGDVSVGATRQGHHGRFDVMPDDVAEELRRARESTPANEFAYLMISRRTRDLFNSNGFHLPAVRKRNAYNPACLAPIEMARLALNDGDLVEISSANGTVRAIVRGDDSLRPGVVSLTHGWGGAPGDESDPREVGTNINPLISDNRDVEAVNAMPRMTAIPVNIYAI